MAEISSPTPRHLRKEAILRIEVSLSSRKCSVVVFNTTCRLYSLESGQWREVVYGAPCISLVRETTALDSPFHVYLVIAEIESGLSLWEAQMGPGSDYQELQPTYHSFKANRKTMILNLSDEKQAGSLLNSLQQYLEQKTQVDKLLENRRKGNATADRAEKGKSPKKGKHRKPQLSKSEISLPCNFQHLSGLTLQNTGEHKHEHELEESIQRRIRSQSLSSYEKKGQNTSDAVVSDTKPPDTCVSSHMPGYKKKSMVQPHRSTKQKALVEDCKGVDDTVFTVSSEPVGLTPTKGKASLIASAEPVNEVARGWDESDNFSRARSLTVQQKPGSSMTLPLRLEKEPMSTQHTLLSSPNQPVPALETTPWQDPETSQFAQNSYVHSINTRQGKTVFPSETSQSASTTSDKLIPHGVQQTIQPPLVTHDTQTSIDYRSNNIKPTVMKHYQLKPLERGGVARSGPLHQEIPTRPLGNEQLPKRWDVSVHGSTATTCSQVKYPPNKLSAVGMHSLPHRKPTTAQRKPLQSSTFNSSGIDHLTSELSRVLQDFDELITPTTIQPPTMYNHTLV